MYQQGCDHLLWNSLLFLHKMKSWRRQPLLLNNWINWGHSRQPENVCAVEFIRISECHYFKYLALKHFKILDSFTLSLAFSLKFCWIFVQSHTWNVKRLSNEVMVHGPWSWSCFGEPIKKDLLTGLMSTLWKGHENGNALKMKTEQVAVQGSIKETLVCRKLYR